MAAAGKTKTAKTPKTSTKTVKDSKPAKTENGLKRTPGRVAAKTKAAIAATPKVVDPRRSDFVRLAEGRTSRAIEQIRLLGNLSNLSSYDYSQADVEQILETIQTEIAATRSRFDTALQSAKLRKERQQFKLGGFDSTSARA